MNGDLQDSYIEFIERTLKDKVSETPHPDVVCKEYTNIDVDDIQTTTQVTLGMYEACISCLTLFII